MADEQHISPFEAIRHATDDGSEYWSARELAVVLGYTTNFRNFKPAIDKSEIACANSGGVNASSTSAGHLSSMRQCPHPMTIASGRQRLTRERQTLRRKPYTGPTPFS